jgi:hypothetical protein
VTWLSAVGTGLISAVICSRMAFRQRVGRRHGLPLMDFSEPHTTILGLVEVVVPASC